MPMLSSAWYIGVGSPSRAISPRTAYRLSSWRRSLARSLSARCVNTPSTAAAPLPSSSAATPAASSGMTPSRCSPVSTFRWTRAFFPARRAASVTSRAYRSENTVSSMPAAIAFSICPPPARPSMSASQSGTARRSSAASP